MSITGRLSTVDSQPLTDDFAPLLVIRLKKYILYAF